MVEKSNNALKVTLIIIVVILIFGLLGTLGWRYYKNKKKSTVDCKKINANYRNINYTQWTDTDRNAAISIINNQDTSLTSAQLQDLNNDALQQILMGICGPSINPTNCSQINANYSKKDYTQWDDADRNTAISLINNQHSSLQVSYLQTLNNQILYKLLVLYCN